MSQQPADRNGRFARRRELRPVLRDRRIEIELSAIREHVLGERGYAFRSGKDWLQRVSRIWHPGRTISNSRRKIHNQLTPTIDCDGCAGFESVFKVGNESLADLFEGAIAITVENQLLICVAGHVRPLSVFSYRLIRLYARPAAGYVLCDSSAHDL